MPDYQDEIIRKQAEEIEDLQSELVQVYDQLHQKKKHKEKRNAKLQLEPEKEKAVTDDATPAVFLHLLLWHWFEPDLLTDYVRRTKHTIRIRDSWRVAGYLTYLPMLIGTVGFIVGATSPRVEDPIRFSVGLALLLALSLAWAGTVEVREREEYRRAWIYAGVMSYVFTFFTIIPTLYAGPTSRPNWPLVFVGLATLANGGLLEGFTVVLDKRRSGILRSRFAVGPFIASAVILMASYFAGTEVISTSERLNDFVLAMIVWIPLFSPLEIILIAAGSVPFRLSLLPPNEYNTELPKAYIVDTVFINISRVIVGLGWILLYTELIATALFGFSPLL